MGKIKGIFGPGLLTASSFSSASAIPTLTWLESQTMITGMVTVRVVFT